MGSPGDKNSSESKSPPAAGEKKEVTAKKASPAEGSETTKPESKEASSSSSEKKSPESSLPETKDSDEKFSDSSDNKEGSKSDETKKDDDTKEDSKKGAEQEKSKPDETKTKPEESKNKEKSKVEEVKAKSKVEEVKQKSKIEDSKVKPKVSDTVKSKVDDVKSKSKVDKNKVESSKVKSKVDTKAADETAVGPQDSDSSLASTHSGISRKSKKASTEHALRVGFMGAGRMTDCLIRGLLKTEKAQAKNIFVSAKSGKNLDTFKAAGVKTTQRTYDLFGKYRCDIIFLCVHGFVVKNCFKMGGTRPFPLTTNYVPSRKSKYYVLSMIGGIPLSDIKVVLLNPEQHGVSSATFHRVALNASVAYGMGLGAIDVEFDSKKCAPIIRDLLNSLAKMVTIDEGNMDAACAVGGNGLAIMYYFISALSDGGFKMGLSKNASIKLAAKVMNVAAMAVLESNLNLADLRDACCSPSGAAIYGLAIMEKNDMASGIQSAVDAAYRRIKQLCEIEG